MLGDIPINLTLFNCVDKVVSRFGIPIRSSVTQSFIKACFFFVPGAIIRNTCYICYVTPMEHMANNIKDNMPWSSEWESCVSNIYTKLSEKLPTILRNGALVWLPINTFTFWRIPPTFRTVWTSTFTVLWVTYLSMVQHERLATTADVGAQKIPA